MANELEAQRQKFTGLRKLLLSDAVQQQIRMVLPKHLTPERMIRVALSAASRNPKLLECTTESFAKAIIEASELGLEPGSMMGGVHLAPYWNGKRRCNEVQSIVNYRGMMDLARRSGLATALNPTPQQITDHTETKLGYRRFRVVVEE